jgi:excisionase family DNA binding protein
MSSDDIENHLAEYRGKYPSLLSVTQAAEIAGVPLKTIYYWSSTGQLDACKIRTGKRLRIARDCLILFLLGTAASARKIVA